MAIRLKAEVQTDKGNTTNLYFHISEFYRHKSGTAKFPVKYFSDETKSEKVEIFEGDLKKLYEFKLTPEEVGSDKIEKMAYDKIGAVLKDAGLQPESDETGSWVAY
jgi:hypothetical protein